MGQPDNEWIRRDVQSIWHGFTQMAAYADNSPVIADRAEGREIIDTEGRRYLDAISSLWVTTLGHRVPELDQALIDQIGKVAHTTMLGNGNTVAVAFAEALNARLPLDDPRLLFASDGAAAVEQALKIAFQFWTNQGVTNRTSYLAFGDAYHGDTIGSLSVGAGGFGTDVFDPLRFACRRAPGYTDPRAIEVAIEMIESEGDGLAAVICEPIVQGAAGIQVHPASAFAALGDACRNHDVLLICDEVAVGFGRTGTMFASEQCGLRPDLMALGKGIAAGYLPMSATAASARVHREFLGDDLSERTFYHGHSFGGNALCAAVGLRQLELFDEWRVLDNVVERAAQFSDLLADRVAAHRGVAQVRQAGLMIGVELAPPADGLRWGRKVSAACTERGVLIRPLGDVIVIMPILTTTSEEAERIVDTVAAALDEVCR